MPLILGTNSIKDTGYDVANSLRLNDGSSSYLHKTPSSGGNRRTFTFSTWFKRGTGFGNEQALFTGGNDANASGFFTIYFTTNNRIDAHFWNGSSFDSVTPNGLLRDPTAWTHIVVGVDTTQSTAANRIKWYINGTEQTDLYSTDYPTQNHEFNVNHTTIMQVGVRRNGSGALIGHYDGYLAETVLIDGTQLDQTSFGEFDSDTPNVWKPKDVSGLTFGTNGFYLDYEDSGNLGNDVNGGTDLTQVNLSATNQSLSSCTNNFATFNPLVNFPSNPPDLSEGNLKVETIDSDPGHFGGASTIGVSQGKWYFESTSLSSRELVPAGGGSITHAVGISSDPSEAARQGTSFSASVTGSIIYALNGKYYSTATGTSGASYGSTYAHNDIIGVAIDLDNHKIYFHKNGTYQNSGDPTSGSTGTGAISIPTGLTYFAFVTDVGGSANTSSINFGDPINSISSGNSDSEGFGNFEHAVPSGYFALCTKNLAEYG